MGNKASGRVQSPGLKWRNRAKGSPVPYWCASPAAIKAGYPVKSANLASLAGNDALLIARAVRLQSEMLRWLSGLPTRKIVQNGTFAPVLDLYETDPESPYRALKPGPLATYGVYLRRLKAHIGAIRIDDTDGRDVKRWFATWRGTPEGEDHLPRARMALAVLKAAIRFALVCRVRGAAEFQAILQELEFEAPESRTFAPTADDVVAARRAAHENGAPERALVYALQFETSLRQWDIIGQWFALSDPRPSAVLGYRKKWLGLDWRAIDDNLILARVRPTKTEDTTEVEISFDLSVCPMVVEELANWPAGVRAGPMIVNSVTGLPYIHESFKEGWHKDFDRAGLPKGMWNRDLRAGGITEGGKAGASKDDRRKLAGHAREETTEIYDRDTVEAHRRVMKARKELRAGGTSGKQG